MTTLADISAQSRPDGLTDARIAARPLIRGWLMLVAFTVFCIVIVGGATRLTDSGLSITEWKPLLGVIPPLNEADWQVALEKYRQIPEYKLINRGMSLEEFKVIYWWEWAHRFLGRFIGVLFFVPFLWFLLRGEIESRLKLPLIGLFILGGLQGALGWYMVKSGLVERVDVSQYRLAAHLTLATVIFAGLIWVALNISKPIRNYTNAGGALFLTVLIVFQIALGAFVAGLDAGKGYNTWPLMDGAVIPSGLLIMDPVWRNFFENALTVQFQHRLTAYVLILIVAVYVWRVLARSDRQLIRRSAILLGGLAIAQAVIGIFTLLAQVPISLGLIHQGGALVLLAAALWHLHLISRTGPARLTQSPRIRT